MIITGMTIVTFVPRVVPLLLLPGMRMPKVVERWLSLIAPAILSALLIPDLLLSPSGAALSIPSVYLIASIPTLLVAWLTKNLFGAVITGIAATALLRFISLGIFHIS
jgi:branched-subunit amino acid transport protein